MTSASLPPSLIHGGFPRGGLLPLLYLLRVLDLLGVVFEHPGEAGAPHVVSGDAAQVEPLALGRTEDAFNRRVAVREVKATDSHRHHTWQILGRLEGEVRTALAAEHADVPTGRVPGLARLDFRGAGQSEVLTVNAHEQARRSTEAFLAHTAAAEGGRMNGLRVSHADREALCRTGSRPQPVHSSRQSAKINDTDSPLG